MMSAVSKEQEHKTVVKYEYAGGPVRLGEALYVERSADSDFQSELEKDRGVFVVTAPRQTGKTSLWYNAARHLRKLNFNTGLIDFRPTFSLPEENTRSSKGWTEKLLYATSRRLGLGAANLTSWLNENVDRTMTDLISSFFSDFVRPQLTGPIVVAYDEIDLVQLYPHFTDNFFLAIRSLAGDRDSLDLSFVMIGLNHPRGLIKVNSSSGFNIESRHFPLHDFDPEDSRVIEAWSDGYPAENDGDRRAIAKAILNTTGGQPFLTAWLFEQARRNSAKTPEDITNLSEKLVEIAKKDEGIIGTHFATPRHIIKDRPNLAFRILDVVEKARTAAVPVEGLRPDLRAALICTGLVREKSQELVLKSPVYKAYFDAKWIENLKKSIGVEVEGASAIVSDHPNKRVCIINTGGMISMELRPDGKIDTPYDLNAFFRRFPELFAIADYEAVPLLFKDSSNMNPDDWSKIAETIYQRRDDFDGFVVVHGTDTLPHTASAVAYALGENLNFPVVFVGSQTAPHVIHGDARINLMRACTVATMENIPEVVAVVGDHIHRAVRVQKKDDYRFEGMHSPTFEPLGIIADRIEIKESVVRKPNKLKEIDLQKEFSHNVFKVGLYPGLDPKYLMPVLDDKNLDGVIIETLGIGNVPVEGTWSLIPFIESARKANIPVLLASQFPIQTEMTAKYQPASAPLAAGAIPAANMAPPAAVTKFMWVLAQIKRRLASGAIRNDRKLAEVAKWMNLDLVGEVSSHQSPSGTS
jgi:L-asparaginase